MGIVRVARIVFGASGAGVARIVQIASSAGGVRVVIFAVVSAAFMLGRARFCAPVGKFTGIRGHQAGGLFSGNRARIGIRFPVNLPLFFIQVGKFTGIRGRRADGPCFGDDASDRSVVRFRANVGQQVLPVGKSYRPSRKGFEKPVVVAPSVSDPPQFRIIRQRRQDADRPPVGSDDRRFGTGRRDPVFPGRQLVPFGKPPERHRPRRAVADRQSDRDPFVPRVPDQLRDVDLRSDGNVQQDRRRVAHTPQAQGVREDRPVEFFPFGFGHGVARREQFPAQGLFGCLWHSRQPPFPGHGDPSDGPFGLRRIV